MTSEQVLVALEKYEAILRPLGASPVRHASDSVRPSHKNALEHASWMCGETRGYVLQGELEKAMRWLGFIQAILWTQGVLTIEAMKEDNRSV